MNLAGVKMLLQFRDAADLLRELASAIDELDATENLAAGPGFAGAGRTPIKGKEANL